MKIPANAKTVLDTLQSNGYKAYLVGGCVRDSLIGIEPKDYDIATSARPEEVISLFERVILTGEKHGTVTVVINGENLECTTFRHDGEYTDGRRPDSVEYAKTIEEDLSRRDFTMNAIAYDGNSYIDPFGGIQDISNGTIKAVGSPSIRFEEDALRMFRCIRFACQLEFGINEMTVTSIEGNAKLIRNISSERIREELCKILISNNPGYGFDLLKNNNILEIIIPELNKCIRFNQQNPYHDKDVYEHILAVVEETPNDLTIRLAALFHDIGKPDTFTLDDNNIGHFYNHEKVSADMGKVIMQRLKFDNKTIEDVYVLVKEHLSYCENPKTIKKLITRLDGYENYSRLLSLMEADIKGHKQPHTFDKVEKMRVKGEEIREQKQPLSVKELCINGHDLMTAGIEPGKMMGKILNELLEYVLDNPEENKKELLLSKVKSEYLS